MKKTFVLLAFALLGGVSFAQSEVTDENNIYRNTVLAQIDNLSNKLVYEIDVKNNFSSQLDQLTVFEKLTNEFSEKHFQLTRDKRELSMRVVVPDKDAKHEAYLILRKAGFTK